LTNSQGNADVSFRYGDSRMAAVAGYFGVLPGGDPSPNTTTMSTTTSTTMGTTTTTNAIPANPGDSKNCPDFSAQAQAQAWFDTYFPHYGDIAGLDQDNDGVACESFP
jgi:hypothetical protein